jgi:hypothetical protein
VSRSGNAHNVYYAFWTDTAHRFSPIPLFAVRPGDDVSARLRFANGCWVISIADSTSGSHAVRYTRDETGAAFDLADWLQEHPSFRAVDAAGQDAYPTLSTVRIHGLAVNGTTPQYADMLSTWMSENGGYLAPARLYNGSFAFRPATLSPMGKRYLVIAATQNAAMDRLSALERQWAATANGQTAWRRQLAAAFQTFNAALSNSRWPPRVEVLVNRLIGANRALVAASAAFSKRSTASASRWLKATLVASTTARAIRRTLDVPQMSALQ